MYYLVDYENVHNSGLDGILKLKAKDTVIIFYSLNVSGSVPLDVHTAILNCPAKVKYQLVATEDIPSALDFQISTFLGYLIGTTSEKKVTIVSKDKGYEVLIDFWKNHKRNIKVFLSPTIDRQKGIEIVKIDNDMLKRISAALEDKNLTDKQIRMIYGFFDKAKNNIEYNNLICWNFKDVKGLYAATKKLFYDYKRSEVA
jgi:hypothetical protein